MKNIATYKNGNADIELFEDGTRTIQFEGDLKLDFPLNIDIRVSTACSLGFNPKTGKGTCEFCHESATTDGEECDYIALEAKLLGLPKGIELAIGGNKITRGLNDFLMWCVDHGYVCNLTVNQLHINGHTELMLRYFLTMGLINGLGISYRKGHELNIPEFFIEHPNVVLHVIAGIDDVDEIVSLPFKKVLVLGYKQFGFGRDYFNDNDELKQGLINWYWWVKKLIDTKDVVSFDNLALKQLNIRRFLTDANWDEFNQGEHSMYINAVDKTFSPSSRSSAKVDWNTTTIKDYFKVIEDEEKD